MSGPEWGIAWADEEEAWPESISKDEHRVRALLALSHEDARLVRRTVTPWVPVETGGEGR